MIVHNLRHANGLPFPKLFFVWECEHLFPPFISAYKLLNLASGRNKQF